MSAVTLALLPFAVLLAHALGDFVIQTDHQAAHKMHSWRAMAGHLTGYHVPMAAVVLWTFGASLSSLVFLLVSISTHALFDRRWPVLRLMVATGSEPFSRWDVGRLIVDQVCHATSLFIALALALALA